MKALIINCTLKSSPEFSNTGALAQKAASQFAAEGIVTEVIRLLDYEIKPGTESDMGNGDEWPILLRKIKACDIFYYRHADMDGPCGINNPAAY